MLSTEANSSITEKSDTSNSSLHHIPDHEGGIHFNPPLYRQRYTFVLDTIQRNLTLHSLLDIGCGTCQLLTSGKYRNPHIQLVAAIDVVRYQLDEGCFRLKPLPVEYMIFRRETPLHIYLLHGDATKICNCFQYFDVVTLIEVIEHLYMNDLEHLVKHVFSRMRPRLVIVTTPNSDFNVLFPSMICGQFRHADHKFEFTRQEFKTWSYNIARRYGYFVEFNGVGEAPINEKHRNIGTCTQIATFHRENNTRQTTLTSNEFYQRLSYCKKHELVGFIDYPFGENKPDQVHEQIRYILDMYRLMAEDKARQGDDNHDTFPLTVNSQILINHPRLLNLNLTSETLRSIVEHVGYKMLDPDRIILSEEPLTYTHGYCCELNDSEQNSMISQNEIVKHDDKCNQNEECWD